MDSAQTFGPCFGLGIVTRYPLQAQNVCIRTQSVYGHCEAHAGQFVFGAKKR
jgi:hypothetical protein